MHLDQYATALARSVFQSPCLQAMFHKKISKEAFKFYVLQKIQIAENFQQLLAVGIEKAKNLGDQNLASSLERNLMDEQGVGSDGLVHLENSHRYWLSCFLKALDINPASQAFRPLASAQAHCRAMLELEKADVFKIVGAVLMIERIVPLEYRAVQKSRDYCFPEEFVITPNDALESQQKKQLARKYIDDHIVHDAVEHFPDLLQQLKKYQTNEDVMIHITEGMKLIANARLAFFHELDSTWSSLYYEPHALAV